MRKNFLSLCLIGAIVLVAGFIACSENGEMNDGVEHLYRTKLERDLFAFADKHAELMNEFLVRHIDGALEEMEDPSETIWYDKMEQNLHNFFEKYDVTVLSRMENEPCLDEDSLDMLVLDEEMFLSYIEQHDTKAFYMYCEQIFVQGQVDLTKEEVITHPDLRLDEKIKLLVILPVLEEISESNVQTKSENPCLDQYNSDRTKCAAIYALECIVGCVTQHYYEVATATINYANCLDEAHDTYMDCLNAQK